MTVHLVGAGPGGADLLTRRAAHLLARADVIVHDRLVSDDVLALAGPGARLVDVGKTLGRADSQGAINRLLVELGGRHGCVVRLKGSDPYVFGRGGEEVDVLHAAGIAVEVVPGVTSAFAAPALAGIPVTYRGLAHGVTVVTAAGRDGEEIDLSVHAVPGVTLVVLMGVARRARVAAQLLGAGLSGATPVAVIERAATPTQRTTRGRLDRLARMDVASPAVLVIGEVAAMDLTGQVDGLVALAGAASHS